MTAVIVAGSRSIRDILTDEGQRLLVFSAIKTSLFDPDEIVSGTAHGVDKLGEAYAEANDLDIAQFPADWEQHGRKAGPLRNTEMAEYADALIAIHVNDSAGTADMVRTGKKILGSEAVEQLRVDTTISQSTEYLPRTSIPKDR